MNPRRAAASPRTGLLDRESRIPTLAESVLSPIGCARPADRLFRMFQPRTAYRFDEYWKSYDRVSVLRSRGRLVLAVAATPQPNRSATRSDWRSAIRGPKVTSSTRSPSPWRQRAFAPSVSPELRSSE